MPSPHTDNQHRRKHQEAGETKPALHPVHIGRDGGDLIREEVGQTEPKRDAGRGGARVGPEPTVQKATLGLGIPARRSRPASGLPRPRSSDPRQRVPTGA